MRSPLSSTLRAIAFALLLAGVAVAAQASGFESDTRHTQVVSTLIGGKNVFIPSTIVVVAGQEHTLSLFNTTDAPHGFAIDGLGIEAVLPVGEEYELKLPTLEGGKVYGIRCHLHPPHREGTLVVLPAKE
jgi:hypothetical protein